MELNAVILAEGEPKRMDRDKAWEEFGGKSLVQLAVEKARELGAEEILISGRAAEDYSALKCPVLLDLEPGFGPLGGIERGLHKCTSPLLLVLAVDLPQTNSALLARMQKTCDRLTGVVPKLNGEIEPLAAIYPKRSHKFTFTAIARSQHSARDFAAACLRERAVRTFTAACGEASAFLHWSRPGDVSGAGLDTLN